MPEVEKIRVMLVDDNPETRENIRRLIQFMGDVEVVGAARSGLEAIELASETDPDVVLMDINMPDMDGITATEAIRRKNPIAQIVILSVQNDPNYMRKAMLVGARDFLNKPPMLDELDSAIHRVGEMAKDERRKQAYNIPVEGGKGPRNVGPLLTKGRIILTYSPKGGVGCTTIATNLAIALQQADNKIIVVDGDLQFGDVAVFFNEQPRNSVYDLTMRANELDADIVTEVVIVNNKTGMHLLAAPPRPEMADGISGDQFSAVINYLKTLYNYIIVDIGSNITAPMVSALDCSDVILLITTQEIPAIKSVKNFLTLLEQMTINKQRIVFVMNKFDKRINLMPDRIGETLKQEISAVLPFDDKIVINSVNSGVPFMVDNKIQPIGKSVSTLADIVKEKINKMENLEIEQSVKKL